MSRDEEKANQELQQENVALKQEVAHLKALIAEKQIVSIINPIQT